MTVDSPRGADRPSSIGIVATGGTIANTVVGRVGVDALLKAVAIQDPSTVPDRIEVVEVARVGADELGPREWIAIAGAVQGFVDRDDIDGVVVTHGTYTAEETAFFLHLIIRTQKPIVVTCAQRKFQMLGSDSLSNLADAFRVVTCHDSRGRGAVLVINEVIHCARDVSKTSQRLWGFQSGEAGPLGTIESDRITFFRSPSRLHTRNSQLSVAEQLPRVDIVSAYPGADDVVIRACAAAGAAGLVLAGMPYRGWPAPGQRAALEELCSSGVPVVMSNRGMLGRVPAESDVFVTGDSLTPHKARILLMVALATPGMTRDRQAMQSVFDTY